MNIPFRRAAAAAALATLSAAVAASESQVLAWNRVALEAVERSKPTQHQVVRLMAWLSLAQHAAAVDAPRDGEAIASASRRVIAALLPAAAPGDPRLAPAAADAGSAIADRVLAQAEADGFSRAWTGTPPAAADAWRSLATPAAAPAYPGIGSMRTFFIASGDALRAPAPPPPASERFARDLAEVRALVAAASPQHVRIARRYDMTTGTMAGGFWNEQATGLIREARLDEREASRVLTTANFAMMDALVACHDSKYAYWVPRPSQADPALRALIGVPNHPSYPSNHSCLSTAAGQVLAHFFPSARERLAATSAEAGMSRIYAGIHYRFDVEAGDAIGRGVAAAAVSRHAEAIERARRTLASR